MQKEYTGWDITYDIELLLIDAHGVRIDVEYYILQYFKLD